MEDNLIEALAEEVRRASRVLASLDGNIRQLALKKMASHLRADAEEIAQANLEDVEAARAQGLAPVLVDRLKLSRPAIEWMAGICEMLAEFADPLGSFDEVVRRPSGVEVGRMRVPLGVLAMVYEARPIATMEAVALCIKSGNGLILRGGAEALRSNRRIETTLKRAAAEAGIPAGAFRLVPRADHADVKRLCKLSRFIDVIIPRGGPQLIATVSELATMPLMRHGPGTCHVYVDQDADVNMAVEILLDGKIQNPSICNSTEGVIVHTDIAPAFWAKCAPALREAGVEVRADERTRPRIPWAKAATEEDRGREYLDLVLSAHEVSSFDEALGYIERHGTNHTEVIVTKSLERARHFQRVVDASAVIVNGSTRLNEGPALGLGTQFGISTSKLQAYGPIGLRELTTTKFVVTAQGHLRGAPNT